MARLDRLERAKDIAQIASVIGRQFSYDVLEAISAVSGGDLRAGLDRLCKSGLIFETESDDQSSSYSFNHSLVQEAALQVFREAVVNRCTGKLPITWNIYPV